MRTLILLLFCLPSLQAQLSFSTSINKNNAKDWNQFFYDLNSSFDGNRMFHYAYGLGVGYNLGLQNIRIDFQPNIDFAMTKGDTYDYAVAEVNNQIQKYRAEFNFSQFNFGVLMKAYPFSFKDKDRTIVLSENISNPFRDFYFLIYPSFSRVTTKYNMEAIGNRGEIDRTFTSNEWRMGLGFGLDLIVHRSLTLSPFVALHRMKNVPNEFINEHVWDICPSCPYRIAIEEKNSEVNQIQFGLNFILNLK